MKEKVKGEEWREKRRKEVLDESRATAAQTRGKNGLFQEIPPTCIGDPFQDARPTSRDFAKGKPNFKAGKRPGNGFTPLPPSATEPIPASAATARATRKLRPSPLLPFRGGGPIERKPVFAFSATDSTMSQDEVKRITRETKEASLLEDKRRIRRIRDKTQTSRPNIVTNPTKKGMPLDGVFLASSEGRPAPPKQRKPKAPALSAEAAERKPFCSSGGTAKPFFATDAEMFIHKPLCADRVVRRRDDGGLGGSDGALAPFRPGGVRATDDFPEYMPFYDEAKDPAAARRRRRRPGSDGDSTDGPALEVWRPSNISGSRPVRSVMLNRVALKQKLTNSRR